MADRVTMRDVAERAGVSVATVSLTLKGDTRVSTATQQRVREWIGRLGYQPDPLLSALSAYQRGGKPARASTVIAWLTAWPTRDGWRRRKAFSDYHDGAAAQAAQMGYRLDHFWLLEHGPAGTARILRNRGIRALIAAPMPEGRFELDFHFSSFRALHIGRSLHQPRLPSVTHNHYAGMMETVQRLMERGYRRIGFAILESRDRIQGYRWSAALLALRERWPDRFASRPLFHPEEWDRGELIGWVKDERCDVVVSDELQLFAWLREAGLRVPDDVGFACPAFEEPGDVSGVLFDARAIGAHAVLQTHNLLTTGRARAPSPHQSLVIEGTWHEGTTLRPPV